MIEPTTINPTATDSILVLAQTLAEQSRITEKDWHRLKSNRKARAQEQIATALVFLLKDNPEQALAHLQQATGWLDRSITAPPCPSHGSKH
jgi:anti-sigma factor ChrR (cupin superfamily)